MIKVTIEDRLPAISQYPKLMKWCPHDARKPTFMVIMTDSDGFNGEGVVVQSYNPEYPVGRFSANFVIDEFVDYRGVMTLENE